MTVEIIFVIERDGREVELVISGRAQPHTPTWITATVPTDGFGEIEEIHYDTGEPWEGELTEKELFRIEDMLYEQFVETIREKRWVLSGGEYGNVGDE